MDEDVLSEGEDDFTTFEGDAGHQKEISSEMDLEGEGEGEEGEDTRKNRHHKEEKRKDLSGKGMIILEEYTTFLVKEIMKNPKVIESIYKDPSFWCEKFIDQEVEDLLNEEERKEKLTGVEKEEGEEGEDEDSNKTEPVFVNYLDSDSACRLVKLLLQVSLKKDVRLDQNLISTFRDFIDKIKDESSKSVTKDCFTILKKFERYNEHSEISNPNKKK